MSTTTTVFREAAEAAAVAPSIFNTQPWRWQATRTRLRLWADYSRQLMVADPQARMLTISCGVALHHARLALAADGCAVSVDRLPDAVDSDLLAELNLTGAHEPTLAERALRQEMTLRHTDRRAFLPVEVPGQVVLALREAAETEGAHLHLVGKDDIAVLALAAVRADALHLSNPDYRRELIRWTHRPSWSGDGVSAATAVDRAPRAVPVRDFVPFGQSAQPAGAYTDRGALYAVIFTDDDSTLAWLRAGEALSAVLLTATAAGLGTAPISDVTELAVTREQLGQLLPGAGVPQLAVRIGFPPPGSPPPSPRRSSSEVIFL